MNFAILYCALCVITIGVLVSMWRDDPGALIVLAGLALLVVGCVA